MMGTATIGAEGGAERGAAPVDEQIGAAVRIDAGATLGRYVVIDRIAAGGMGVVYRAYDPVLARRVALKVLRPELSGGARSQRRLLREAWAMAQLSHPNVAAIYDAGLLGERVFIAMELVSGKTLSAYLTRRVGWIAVVRAFAQAARGLAAAHAAGLVHRDFKPDNVLVGDDGRVRVVDFGLVRAEPGGSRGEAALPYAHGNELATTAGCMLGTPAFMAPEAIRGEPLDARADQYSFCVALFHGLYGAYPYGGATLPQRGGSTIVARRPAGARVPERIHGLLVRGLALRPADRHHSMDVLAESLERAIAPARGAWIAAVVDAVFARLRYR